MADALTRPADQLTEAGQRQQARMLASIAAALLATCLVVLPAWMLLLPYYEENRPISAFMIVAMSVMYGLSRTRHYQAAAAGLVAAIIVMVALIVATSPGDVNERIHTLYFLLIAILIANFFFRWRVVLGLVGVCLLAIVAFYLWFSVPAPLAISFTVFFSVTIALSH